MPGIMLPIDGPVKPCRPVKRCDPVQERNPVKIQKANICVYLTTTPRPAVVVASVNCDSL